MSTTRILTIFAAVLYLVFWLAVIAVSIYLLSLIIRALKKYINSGEVRKEKKDHPKISGRTSEGKSASL